MNFRPVHLSIQPTSLSPNLVLDSSWPVFLSGRLHRARLRRVGVAAWAECVACRIRCYREKLGQFEIKKPPRRGALKSLPCSKVRLGTFGFGHVKQGLLPFRDLLVDSELASLRLVGKFEHDVEHDFFHD